MIEEVIKIEIISGCEGMCLAINDYRVAGPKAWGGGRVVYSFETDMDRLRSALPSIPTEPATEGK